MSRLQNHIPNMNMTKYQDAYQEKDLVLTLDHLMSLMYRFVRKIWKNLQKQQMVLPVFSNLSQPLFQVLLSQHHDFLASYYLVYCVKFKFTCKEKFFEQLPKHRDNKIIKDICLLTSKQSTSTRWFSFH